MKIALVRPVRVPARGRARASSSTRSATWRPPRRAGSSSAIRRSRASRRTSCSSRTSTATTTRSSRRRRRRTSCARPPGTSRRRSARSSASHRSTTTPPARKRGPNTIFGFTLDGLRVCHFGDFGQAALRPEQRAAIGEVDVLFAAGRRRPDGRRRAGGRVVRELAPRLVVPMHYRTAARQLPRAARRVPRRARRTGRALDHERGRGRGPARLAGGAAVALLGVPG